MKGNKNMKKIILCDEQMQTIATYMNDEIREWCHDTYMGCEPEVFLKQYYLRLIYEQGEEAADEFEEILSSSSELILWITFRWLKNGML